MIDSGAIGRQMVESLMSLVVLKGPEAILVARIGYSWPLAPAGCQAATLFSLVASCKAN